MLSHHVLRVEVMPHSIPASIFSTTVSAWVDISLEYPFSLEIPLRYATYSPRVVPWKFLNISGCFE